jgi:hypothetical protein
MFNKIIEIIIRLKLATFLLYRKVKGNILIGL